MEAITERDRLSRGSGERGGRGRNTRQANKAHLDGYMAIAARSFAKEMMPGKGDDFVEPAVSSGFKADLTID